MLSTKDWMDTDDVLGFKQMKGKFSRSQALRVKCELRRLAWR
jgi:hypothetical protein